MAPGNPRTPARRRISPGRAARAAAHVAQSPTKPSIVPRRVHRGALPIPDPRTGRIDPGSASSANPGELQGPTPPLAVPRSDQAPIHRPFASGGLRISRSALPTQISSFLTPGRPRMAISGAAPLRSSTPATERRHPARPTARGRSIPDPQPGIDQARVKQGEYRSAPANFVKETPAFPNINPQSLPV